MKNTLLASTAALALASSAQAALVTIDFNLLSNSETAIELVGPQVLALTITEGDVTFTANATISGTQVNGGSNLKFDSQDVEGTGVTGYILMRSNTGNTAAEQNNSEITVTLGDFVQTAGTAGASISFDGITNYLGSNQTSGKSATIGGVTYTNVSTSGTIVDTTLTGTNPYKDSEFAVTIDSTGGNNWRLHSTDAQFTVTAAAVPEPSSTALLGLGGLALILRRRK